MKVLIQRVKQAAVEVDQKTVGQIGQGLLVFVGVEKDDSIKDVDKLVSKILSYRVFQDEGGKMNLSVNDIQGDLLLVSQFTLAADTKKGARPSFSSAAEPEIGKLLFDEFVILARKSGLSIETGIFGADMQVSLINDGPVTFNLSSK